MPYLIRVTRALLLLTLIGTGSAARATPAEKPATAVTNATAAPTAPAVTTEIVSAEFGIFDTSQPGELLFSPSDSIPHKPGQRYGWVIEVRTHQRSLMVREEYLLPSKAPIYPVPSGTVQDDSLTVVHPRRHQVSERRLVPVDGRIFGEWAIGPQEPPGARSLLVVVEGAPDTQFDFRVE